MFNTMDIFKRMLTLFDSYKANLLSTRSVNTCLLHKDSLRNKISVYASQKSITWVGTIYALKRIIKKRYLL